MPRGLKIGDQGIDPATFDGGGDGLAFSGSASHSNAARDGLELIGADTKDSVVERGVDQGPTLVEEPEANVTDRAELPEFCLLTRVDGIPAVLQQR